jgi:hydrogenase maturation protease
MRALVIAYGNPLRGDDGIAWRIANEMRGAGSNDIRVLCVHQLMPELAEAVSESEIVVFLDAAADGEAGLARCRSIEPQSQPMRFWHHMTPGELLGLCERLYATKPLSFLVTVPGECFENSDTLSDAAASAIPQALTVLRELIEQSAQRAMDSVTA